jgi:hypothetical protein
MTTNNETQNDTNTSEKEAPNGPGIVLGIVAGVTFCASIAASAALLCVGFKCGKSLVEGAFK